MLSYRKGIQIGTLILFMVLIVGGRVQLWMGIFGISLLLSVFLGRFYCGYMCPINTGMEMIDENARKKERRRRREVPEGLKKSWVRYGILILFLATMVLVLKTGKKLPVLPALFAIGIGLTLFFQPELWHRYLCPYGSLLSIFSRFNKRGYNIQDQGCNKCGLCVRICPSDAIEWETKEDFPNIVKNECLLCGRCQESCGPGTIDYGKEPAKQSQEAR